MRIGIVGLVSMVLTAGWPNGGEAADWPMWRCDAARSGASPADLPDPLHLQWTRRLPPPRPAWPGEPRLEFDATYEPVAYGGRLFVPSAVDDSLTALDAASGRRGWRFHAEGPVRLAPAVWQGKVYFVADDGYLYCLDAETGRLLWKRRGGPDERRVLGNGRLISMWPARGGPVIADGVVYFAAGLWPTLGVFVHAVDAATGWILWTNDTSGTRWGEQPHGSFALNGLSPQGHLVLAGDKLLLPNGRSYPAVFDAGTGSLLAYQMGFREQVGCQVVATKEHFFAGVLCGLTPAGPFEMMRNEGYWLPVLADAAVYRNTADARGGGDVVEAQNLRLAAWETVHRHGKDRRVFSVPTTWRLEGFRASILAGRRLFGVSGSDLAAVELPAGEAAPRITWREPIDGKPAAMLAADDRLFVVTAEGQILCYGSRRVEPVHHAPDPAPPPAVPDARAAMARRMIEMTGREPGFGLVVGVGDGRLVEELVRQSSLHVIAIDSDAEKIESLRQHWGAAGWYGRRVAAIVAEPMHLPLPPYFCRLIASDDPTALKLDAQPEAATHLFGLLRPLGGVASLPLSERQHGHLGDLLREANSPEGVLQRDGEMSVVRRSEALPGSGNWTHEYADAANTRTGPDRAVKTPLGVLWFGGPLENSLLYHKSLKPPVPLIVDGRMFVQGPGALRAVDIYTGTILWTVAFDDDKEDRSLTFSMPDYRMTYRQPASESRDYTKVKRVGYYYAAAEDGVYVAYGQKCLWLDPATGEVNREIVVGGENTDAPLYWNDIRLWEDVLLGTAVSPDVPLPDGGFGREELGSMPKEFLDFRHIQNLEAIPANYLVAVDRHSGDLLWRRAAHGGFVGAQHLWHLWGTQAYQNNSVATGEGKVFCLDALSPDLIEAMKRRGVERSGAGELIALDIRSGKTLWRKPVEAFCSLAYSAEYDVLVQADVGQIAPSLQGFVGQQTIARKGSDGSILWKADQLSGPYILHHQTLFTGTVAIDLLTGKRLQRAHPLTGKPAAWSFYRGYGCGVPIAGENLLTYRSAAAAYYDFTAEAGTANFGGIRAGCTNTLIPAGGLLNAPNTSHGCGCNYQMDTSLALVPMDDVDAWSYSTVPTIDAPVRRLGINFAAPGARRAHNGTLWLPSAGALASPVVVSVEPVNVRPFTWHSSRVGGDSWNWVAASGIDGLQKLSIRLLPTGGKPVRYSVRMVFVEPQPVAAGDRVFDIAVQGVTRAERVDLAAEAGQSSAVVKHWKGVEVDSVLTITFTPTAASTIPYATISGIEIVAEGEYP